ARGERRAGRARPVDHRAQGCRALGRQGARGARRGAPRARRARRTARGARRREASARGRGAREARGARRAAARRLHHRPAGAAEAPPQPEGPRARRPHLRLLRLLRPRAQNLERLRSQQAGLEKLLRELRAAVERFPIEGNDVFARLRGRLAWPVSGRVLARFGDARAGGVRWDGVLVATERGAPVKAVCQGRVIYADWLPGLGLLTIVDHGDGYLSLYGHNERLYKAAGEPVATGDTIAAAG